MLPSSSSTWRISSTSAVKFVGREIAAVRRRDVELDGRGPLQSPADHAQPAAIRLLHAVAFEFLVQLRPLAADLRRSAIFEPLAGGRLSPRDAERIGQHAASFQMRLERGLAQPMAGLSRDVGGHERMPVAIAAHPRAETQHRAGFRRRRLETSPPPRRAIRRAPSGTVAHSTG